MHPEMITDFKALLQMKRQLSKKTIYFHCHAPSTPSSRRLQGSGLLTLLSTISRSSLVSLTSLIIYRRFRMVPFRLMRSRGLYTPTFPNW